MFQSFVLVKGDLQSTFGDPTSSAKFLNTNFSTVLALDTQATKVLVSLVSIGDEWKIVPGTLEVQHEQVERTTKMYSQCVAYNQHAQLGIFKENTVKIHVFILECSRGMPSY